MNRATRRRIAKLVKRQKQHGIMPRRNDPVLKELNVVNLLYNGNTEAPEELQRPLSWRDKNKEDFFDSICMNRISGEIIIVDCEVALESLEYEVASKKNNHYDLVHKAIKLFKDCLKKGLKYIVLDGNNRLMFYIDLLNDKWSIPSGTYEYIRQMNDSETCTFKVTDKANKFSDLPAKVRNAILSRTQLITEYTQIDWINMSLVFINTNSMVPPNAQELRNASVSEWADWIRKLRKTNLTLLNHLFENPLNRYTGDEWIVSCLDFAIQAVQESENTEPFERLINEGKVDEDGRSIAEAYSSNVNCSGISQTTMFGLYDCDLLPKGEKNYYEGVFESLEDYLSRMIKSAPTLEAKKALKTKSLVQNLFWMMCNGIDTYAEAVEAVKLHQKAHANSILTYGQDEATFKNACSGTSKANIEFRFIILKGIIDDVRDGNEIQQFLDQQKDLMEELAKA